MTELFHDIIYVTVVLVLQEAGLEAQWLDLIRSAVQDQFRGKSRKHPSFCLTNNSSSSCCEDYLFGCNMLLI